MLDLELELKKQNTGQGGASHFHNSSSVVGEKGGCWVICPGSITSEKEVRPYEREGVHY